MKKDILIVSTQKLMLFVPNHLFVSDVSLANNVAAIIRLHH